MFVIKQSDSYSWPVSFKIPVDDGGYAEQSFTGEFRRVDTAATEKLVAEIQSYMRAADVGFFPDEMRRPAEMAADVLVGWKGVKDGDNEEVKFSPATMKAALGVHGCAVGVLNAWNESLSGGRRKN